MNYDIYIMAVPQRAKSVKVLSELLSQSIVCYDFKMEGSHKAAQHIFNKAYKAGKDIIILQDDVILTNHFNEIVNYLHGELVNRKIDVISLYAPRSKKIVQNMKKGAGIYRLPISLFAGVANMYSYSFVKKVVSFDGTVKKGHFGDDYYTTQVIKHNKIKPHVYLPSVVQHNIEMQSTLGHPNISDRSSPVFDINHKLL